jgi:hypothetical protein
MHDGILGDLVKHHAPDLERRLLLPVKAEGRQKVPGDRLPFAVGVRREEQGGDTLHLFLDGVDVFLALGEDRVLRLEVVFDVDRPLLAREGAHVTERGQHLVLGPQEFLYGLRLGGRLYYDKMLGHVTTWLR